jgi:hypothetical protein
MQPACSLCYRAASVALGRARPHCALRRMGRGLEGWDVAQVGWGLGQYGCEREVVLRLETDEGSLHSAV